tara:strand:- start:438 stop:623 length:186 start_codon:yes stop_codon:yes gene_type:complete
MIETPIQDWDVVVAILFSLMAILLLSVFFLIKVQIAFVNHRKAKLVKVSEFDNNRKGEKNE